MNLFFDRRLNKLVRTPGLDQPIEEIDFKAGDGATLVVQFGRSPDTQTSLSVVQEPQWTPELLPGGATITIGIKSPGEYTDCDFLATTSTYVANTEAKTYTFDLSLNTVEINNALNRDDGTCGDDIVSLPDCNFEVTYDTGTATPFHTHLNNIFATIWHDVILGDESTPNQATDPDQYALTKDTLELLRTVTELVGGTASDLDAVVTVGRAAQDSVLLYQASESDKPRIYELVVGNDATASPQIIQPLDNASSNLVWKLRDTSESGHPGGDKGAVLAKNSATDLDFDWTREPTLDGVWLQDGISNTKGVAGGGADGAFVVYSTDGTYNPVSGGMLATKNGLELHGSSVEVTSLAGTGARQVWCNDAGQLMPVDAPDPGWEETDTDAGSYDLGTGTGTGAWVNLTGLEITVPEDTDAGDRVTIFSNISAANKTTNRQGSVELTFTLNGVEQASVFAFSIPPGFDGILPLSITSQATELFTGDVIGISGRITGGDNAAYGVDLDGATVNHTLDVAKAGASTATTDPGIVSVKLNADQTTGGGTFGAYTKINFDNTVMYFGGTELSFDPGTNSIMIDKSGYYRVDLLVESRTAVPVTDYGARIYWGPPITNSVDSNDFASSPNKLMSSVSTVQFFTASTALQGWFTSGTASAGCTGGNYATQLTVERVRLL